MIDAAERAGLGHLTAPLRLAAIAVALFTLLCGTLALVTGVAAKWFFLGPLVAPLFVAATVFYCARGALWTAGKLIGMAGADAKLVLAGRSVLGLVLCCEAALGLLILGTYSLSLGELTVSQARFLSYLVGSSIALFLVIFARAATSAQFASYGARENAPTGPHPGSLALLVSATFHAPFLKLVTLVLLSTLGHCALLSVGELPGQTGKLWLYPHLLKLLGLFGLLFAGLVVRTSEEESGGEGWVRGAVVYLVLMVAGCWSLSSQLPTEWARSVPSGLSFFYLSLGASLWLASTAHARSAGSLGRQARLNMPSFLLFLGLLLALILSASVTPETTSDGTENDASTLAQLPSSALLGFLLSGALAPLPIAFTWIMARTIAAGSREAEQLAYVGESRTGSARAPSPRLLLALPMLSVVIVLTALGATWTERASIDGLMFTLFGLSAIFSGLTLIGLLGHVERSALKARGEVALLLSEQRVESVHLARSEAAPINFEAAVVRCRETTSTSALSWLLLCLTPSWAAGAALLMVPTGHFQSLALGLGTGATLLAVGFLLLQGTDADDNKRSFSNLAFISAVAQGLWLLATGSFPA